MLRSRVAKGASRTQSHGRGHWWVFPPPKKGPHHVIQRCRSIALPRASRPVSSCSAASNTTPRVRPSDLYRPRRPRSCKPPSSMPVLSAYSRRTRVAMCKDWVHSEKTLTVAGRHVPERPPGRLLSLSKKPPAARGSKSTTPRPLAQLFCGTRGISGPEDSF